MAARFDAVKVEQLVRAIIEEAWSYPVDPTKIVLPRSVLRLAQELAGRND